MKSLRVILIIIVVVIAALLVWKYQIGKEPVTFKPGQGSKLTEALELIPADAIYVLEFNFAKAYPHSEYARKEWSKHIAEELKDADEDDKAKLAALITYVENPETTGIDFEGAMYIYLTQEAEISEDNNEVFEVNLMLPLSDGELFHKMILAFSDDSDSIQTVDGIFYYTPAAEKEMCFAWGEKTAAMTLNMVNDIDPKHYASTVFNLPKENLLKNENFQTWIKQSRDIGFWADIVGIKFDDDILKTLQGFFTGSFEALYEEELYCHINANLDIGEIRVEGEYFPSAKAKPLYEEIFQSFNRTIDMKTMKAFPAEGLLGMVAFSTNMPEMMNYLYTKVKKMPEYKDEMKQALAGVLMLGLSEENILNFLGGDVIIAIGTPPAEKGSEIHAIVGLGIEDTTLFDRLKGMAEATGIASAKKDYYVLDTKKNIGSNVYVALINKMLWSTNNETSIGKLIAGKNDVQLSKELLTLMEGKTLFAWADVGRLLKFAAPFTGDKEATMFSANAATIFDKFVGWNGMYKSELKLTLKNKDQHALDALTDLGKTLPND
ncbi:MAG: DUF4836 family protein [Candidatus Cloacimonetes bacterium]|nr:DUF4836 family protein [Candidatus Cloacimonadota bacterium]